MRWVNVVCMRVVSVSGADGVARTMWVINMFIHPPSLRSHARARLLSSSTLFSPRAVAVGPTAIAMVVLSHCHYCCCHRGITVLSLSRRDEQVTSIHHNWLDEERVNHRLELQHTSCNGGVCQLVRDYVARKVVERESMRITEEIFEGNSCKCSDVIVVGWRNRFLPC